MPVGFPSDRCPVSPVLRYVLVAAGLCVLFAVSVVVAARPATEAEQRPFHAFPASVTLEAPRLPQYADGAQTRIRQQLASVDAMWTDAFAGAGDRYEQPRLVEQPVAACGSAPSGWAGLYCVRERSIIIDVEAHVARNEVVGQGHSDLVLGYIVAHEVGHHVQELRAVPRESVTDPALRTELHADCLAGVWGKAVGLPLPPMWAYGEDADHGTATQRVTWLNRGYRSAQPADCDAIWTGAAL